MIALFVFGIIFVFISFVLLLAGISEAEGIAFFTGLVTAAIAFAFLYPAFHILDHKRNNTHAVIYKKLKAEGWPIQSRDLHLVNGPYITLNLNGCPWDIDLANKTWTPEIKRSDSIGGGYRPFTKSMLAKLAAVCGG